MRYKKYLKLQQYANKMGWELISTQDSNIRKPLLWKNLKTGCISKKRWESVLKSGFEYKAYISEIKSQSQHKLLLLCKQKNIELISDINTYRNSRQSLIFKDSDGLFSCNYNNLKKLKIPRSNKWTISDLKKFAESKGGKCLSDKYINPHTKYLWEDEFGFKWKATWNAIVRGAWSPNIAKKRAGQYRKLDLETIRSRVMVRGYKLLDNTYTNARQKITLECKNKHIWKVSLDHFKQGNDCPRCYSRVSKAEGEVFDWISQYVHCEKKIFSFSNNIKLECDIYIPELSLGIEYNGLYWHSEAVNKHRNHLKVKSDMFGSIGIKIIHIFEDEWKYRKKQVQNFLLSKIPSSNYNTIYARKCHVSFIDEDTAKDFINAHHIQPVFRCQSCVGIFYNNVLIGVTAFNKHHRINNLKNTMVLSRMCYKDGHRVVGGASKMLKFFIKNFPDVDKIISWSDNRISSGNVYEKLKFVNDLELKPDYYYFLKNGKGSRINKQRLTKKTLFKKGAKLNTEKEMAKSLGYIRIYDAGKIRWTLNTKDYSNE